MKYNKRAFTLIELLVVVLIIGILAAVAVPQYQKAVTKSHISEMQQILSNIEKAAEMWRLANGLPSSNKRIEEELEIDYLSGFPVKNSDMNCNTARTVCLYVEARTTQIYISLLRINPENGYYDYFLVSRWTPTTGWKREAQSCAKDITGYGLESFGFTMGSCY